MRPGCNRMRPGCDRACQVGFTLALIGAVSPPFFLGLVPIGALYYHLQRYYSQTARELKRLDSLSRSPLYAFFAESLTGTDSIRAYARQPHFRRAAGTRVDAINRVQSALFTASRWLRTHAPPSRSRPNPVLPLHPPCTPLHAFSLPLPLLHLLALLAPSRTPSYPLAGQPLARPACRDARCRHRQPRRAHLGAWPRAAGPERLDFRRTQVRGAVRRQAEIGGRASGWVGGRGGGWVHATACHATWDATLWGWAALRTPEMRLGRSDAGGSMCCHRCPVPTSLTFAPLALQVRPLPLVRPLGDQYPRLVGAHDRRHGDRDERRRAHAALH